MQKKPHPKKLSRDRQVHKALNQISHRGLRSLLPTLRNFKITREARANKTRFSNFKFIWVLGFSALVISAIYIFWGLPNPANLTRHPSPASTKLLDRHGELIYEIYAVARRTPISITSLPQYVIDAHLAAEDKDFYSHSGFSLRGISRAFLNTFLRQRLQGGSTITQQLVKNSLLTQERTLKRKIR